MEKLFQDFSLGLFFWQALLFIALVFLLKKFAWRPILQAINDRESGIQDALLAAEHAKQDMENLQADNQKLLQEARAERETILKEAREIKNNLIETAKNEAKSAADNLIAQAHAAIETEKKAAINDLKSHVANLSIDIAKKVVGQELSDTNKHTALVQSMLNETTLN